MWLGARDFRVCNADEITEIPMKRRLPAWILLAVGMIICRALYLENVIYNIDEAEYAVAADAMNHHWLPGADLLGSTKPPGIAVLFNLLFHVFGRSMIVIHVAHLVMMIVMGALTVELAAKLWGQRAILPSALLFWIVANSFNNPSEMIALNVETPAVLLGLAAMLIALSRSRRWWIPVVTGALLGLAAMFRQSLLCG